MSSFFLLKLTDQAGYDKVLIMQNKVMEGEIKILELELARARTQRNKLLVQVDVLEDKVDELEKLAKASGYVPAFRMD